MCGCSFGGVGKLLSAESARSDDARQRATGSIFMEGYDAGGVVGTLCDLFVYRMGAGQDHGTQGTSRFGGWIRVGGCPHAAAAAGYVEQSLGSGGGGGGLSTPVVRRLREEEFSLPRMAPWPELSGPKGDQDGTAAAGRLAPWPAVGVAAATWAVGVGELWMFGGGMMCPPSSPQHAQPLLRDVSAGGTLGSPIDTVDNSCGSALWVYRISQNEWQQARGPAAAAAAVGASSWPAGQCGARVDRRVVGGQIRLSLEHGWTRWPNAAEAVSHGI